MVRVVKNFQRRSQRCKSTVGKFLQVRNRVICFDSQIFSFSHREFSRLVAQNEAFFRECYAKSIRDYANILIYTTKRNLRKYCGTSNKKGSRVVKEMLKLAPCANKHLRATRANTEARACYRKYINATSQLVNIADDHRKIPHACCLFADAVSCAEDVLGNIPCIRPHIQTLMDYFRTGTSSITDIMCGDYTASTDACAKLGPPPKALTPNTKKYLTPMAMLIDLMESITDFEPTPTLGGSGGFWVNEETLRWTICNLIIIHLIHPSFSYILIFYFLILFTIIFLYFSSVKEKIRIIFCISLLILKLKKSLPWKMARKGRESPVEPSIKKYN